MAVKVLLSREVLKVQGRVGKGNWSIAKGILGWRDDSVVIRTAPPEDTGLIPSIHKMTYNPSVTPALKGSNVVFGSLQATGAHAVYRHSYRQNIHVHKNKERKKWQPREGEWEVAVGEI